MSVLFSGINNWFRMLPQQTLARVEAKALAEAGDSVTGKEISDLFQKYRGGSATEFELLLLIFISREILGYVDSIDSEK